MTLAPPAGRQNKHGMPRRGERSASFGRWPIRHKTRPPPLSFLGGNHAHQSNAYRRLSPNAIQNRAAARIRYHYARRKGRDVGGFLGIHRRVYALFRASVAAWRHLI